MVDVYVASENGDFISERHARIAEIIKDYDPTLEVEWIPPRALAPGDNMFRLVCRPVGAPEYVVGHFDDLDERVLAFLFEGDNAKGDVLSALEAHNAAVQAVELKRKMEEAEERKEFVASVVRSPLHSYKHNGVQFG